MPLVHRSGNAARAMAHHVRRRLHGGTSMPALGCYDKALQTGERPVYKANFALVAILSITLPALSQDVTSESTCTEAFKLADKNTDGVLTRTEIPKAQQMLPALAKESLVSRQEFMAACVKLPAAQVQQFDKPAAPSPHSTGTSVSPETTGRQQPQGKTGPLETTTGGAPAESPQGQTPPGMQPAPEGSSKTIIDPSVKER
jgi:hypothetical protein